MTRQVKTNVIERRLYTTTEAGEMLGMAARTVERLARQGKIAVVKVASSGKVGRSRHMIAAADIDRFIESNRVYLDSGERETGKRSGSAKLQGDPKRSALAALAEAEWEEQ